ncbi:hypothetical protein [Vulcaniibacterium tengchongense]|uniref:Uncharacterized protein n=1 Tax=Vulcaniibacterium tengchongense TaxID=1273429 RepID=A0A3N4UXD8_9GAMM|nr:hypothetical protein [Vulcaniibacterium tengchongense]RPE74663.1 hypothetical protein EDC50_3192 [Vulcaniibacterium tengchongense]
MSQAHIEKSVTIKDAVAHGRAGVAVKVQLGNREAYDGFFFYEEDAQGKYLEGSYSALDYYDHEGGQIRRNFGDVSFAVFDSVEELRSHFEALPISGLVVDLAGTDEKVFDVNAGGWVL